MVIQDAHSSNRSVGGLPLRSALWAGKKGFVGVHHGVEPELVDGARLRLSPASADTDGFFAAVYQRAA